MPRAIDGTRRKNHRKETLKLAKGYWGRRHSNHKAAKDAVAKALQDSYNDRRNRKTDFRRLWITRINAACRMRNISYSRFMEGLSKADIDINRKMLADMAARDPVSFDAVVEKAKTALQG
ncbi:MAG TPA: 50S ribosomal protein L20 [Rectinema sp.]|jgi:large subunit ribosomal protein L20|nr:MAG: 50S ribosomal protein L20 [Spirochaetes bacterium ADurb.Bin001]HOE99459.1 50S ribosomal protein L20 [Rectinema sp.]HOH16779.1 50S ribosomal protein L20 [Rectinema sp.]HOR90909.1 50S ribosomal protein L20 [Rectinema sp.]HPG90307.1 50S ribosomal protein L20 [Rectinema sp.]